MEKRNHGVYEPPYVTRALAYFGSVFPFNSANAANLFALSFFCFKFSFFLRNTYIVTFSSILLFNTLCPKICFVLYWIALRRREGTLPWESMLANERTTNCSFRTIIFTQSSAGVATLSVEPVSSLGVFTAKKRKGTSCIITHYSPSAEFPAISNR